MKTLPHTQLTPYWRATFFYTNSFRLSGGKRGVLYYIIYRLRNCFLSLLSEMPRCFLFLFLPRDRFTNSESLNFLLVFIQTIFFTGFTFLRSANGPCKCWLLHERKGKKNHTNNRKKKNVFSFIPHRERKEKKNKYIYSIYIYSTRWTQRRDERWISYNTHHPQLHIGVRVAADDGWEVPSEASVVCGITTC